MRDFELSGPDAARFVPLWAPTGEEAAKLLTAIIRKLARAGLLDAEGTDGDQPFAALQAAEVDRRLRFPDPFSHARRAAHLDGFSLHAGVRIHENDREGLARLCRYAVRPPFALHRLSAGADGRLVYRMKRPRGGALFLLLAPDELLARIATLVPPPRSHALRYHGLFAPNAKHRKRVVPARPGPEPCGEGAARHRPVTPDGATEAGQNRSTCLMACFVSRFFATARARPRALTASCAPWSAPTVAFASEATRLA